MGYNTIKTEKKGGIFTVTFNRAEKLNALNSEMYGELTQAFDEIEADADIRVVVFTGDGRAFCAGGDISELFKATDSVDSAQKRLRTSHGLMSRLRRFKQPVIMAVNGDAIGAGCTLALNGDIRIAADTARFGLTFVKVGLVPDMGGIYNLVKLAGIGKACELTLLADIITAAEAERVGIINRVVPAADLEKTVNDWATRLARGPALTLSLAKASLYKAMTMDFFSELEDEINVQSLCMISTDGREGLSAFLEKRKADFGSKKP